MDSAIIKNVEVGWMNPRVLIVCGIYVLLFAAYLYLAFAAVKKKSWKRMVGSIAINTVLLLLILQVGFLWGKTSLAKQTPKEGEYIVSGTNSNNSKYSGKAVISKNGDLYRLKWTIDSSPGSPVQEYASVGFIHDGNLCVHFSGSFSGIAVYRIADEQLIGQWVGDSGLNKDGQQKISRGLEVLKRKSGLTEKANSGDALAKEELIKRKATDDAQRILKEVESRSLKRTDEDNIEKLLQKNNNQSGRLDYNFQPYSQDLAKRAEAGDAKAQYNLGVCYAKGEGVNQEFKYAVSWWTKAAKQDFVLAQHDLGNCYYNGDGINKDYKEAVMWYTKSSVKGYAASQYNLGNCYFYGTGVGKDEKEAVKWYTKSAEQGNVDAQRNLGLCYYKGTGVEKDEQKAAKWFTGSHAVPYSPELVRKADSGDGLAQYNLGIAFYMGAGVGKDEKEAVKWYTKSAEQGNPQAQYNLARCYSTGVGVAKNEKEAVKWYTKSADQGDMAGQFCLGLCYINGTGVKKDEKKAVKLFTEPALSGHPMAQNSLGRCYATGTGVRKDENAAVRWYTRSAEKGDVNGQNAVAWVLATSNDPAIRNGMEAEKWAQKAIATMGSSDANSLDTLAAAYAEQGDFAAAVSTQEKAISTLKDMAKSKEFQTHLKSYQGKKPWRDNE